MMPTRILPNQLIAHQTPAQAWAYGLNLISAYGDAVITEDHILTKEICNLHLTILEPCNPNCWPILGSGWDMAGLNKYAEQLMSRENPTKFAYTYGQRLFAYPDSMEELSAQYNFGVFANFTNQIDQIINRLRQNPSTRRSVAPTWIPWFDHFNNSEVPCLQLLDFLIRNGKLNLTVFFRSQDFARAWPANVYGLSKLLSHVAFEVGCETGSLTTISASAHIYER